MGHDIWGICVFKLQGRVGEVVDSALREGGSVSLRASRVFFDLYRDSQGEVGNRRVVLTKLVLNPKKAKTIAEVSHC